MFKDDSLVHKGLLISGETSLETGALAVTKFSSFNEIRRNTRCAKNTERESYGIK